MPDAPTWDEQLAGLATTEDQNHLDQFIARLPPGYRELTTPEEALDDLHQINELADSAPVTADSGQSNKTLMGPHQRLVVRGSLEDDCTFRLRRFAGDGMELSSALPLLESFGLIVVESVPMRLRAGSDGTAPVHLDDIGIRVDSPQGPETLRFVPDVHGSRLVEAIAASSRGDSDVDSLNRLVTTAGLDWRQVTVLRSYLRYWRQAVHLTWDELADPLIEYPDVARTLVGYFQDRFDPAARTENSGAADQERARCTAQLDLVTHLDEDRVLRGILRLIDATLRTNFYTPGADSRPLVLKLRSADVPELPPPRPLVETFVHCPTVEAVHLRAGLIARGGIRWSERPNDFRTEILDLAFAQVKKNAIIVPTGAKGGFVCRSPAVPHPGGHPRTRPAPEQIRAAYEQFITGLLDVTDNLVGGQVTTPEGVIALDGEDPYLVVAADKGTATFSDLANAISARDHFWLGDAFASGGSRGYDHKAMGITARGAWVAVRRHFRELGIDVSSDPIKVVGVGDMSGDVFGNGMLQSRSIRLIAAFDHRHVFLDPDPDPEVSYQERSRLAALSRSTWADYRSEVISAGGGVWPRDAKAVPLSDAVRNVLGVGEDTPTPPELISAIIAAPVDLLWFGGIGTFIKAPGESDVDVADHDNDAVRITSDRVRARVIAEGANLAVTQRARIRFSRRGGRINADFIDNAAGVATSDREVNLKILLALAMERGRLGEEDRDAYLARSETEVAEEVLRQVDHSVAALNRAATGSDRQLDAYEALVDDLERDGRLDRQVEVLPDRTEFAVRREAGAGLIRPELATILSYAKSDLVAAIEGVEGLRDEVFADSVLPYFPRPIRDDFSDLIPDHRLYTQLAATDIAGEIIDQMGIVWAHDLAAELGCGLEELAGPFWVARHLTQAGELWRRLEVLADDPSQGLTAEAEAVLHSVVSGAVGAVVRLFLVQPGRWDPSAPLSDDTDEVQAGSEPDPENWKALDVSDSLAQQFLVARRRATAVRDGIIARQAGRDLSTVRAARQLVDEAAGVDALTAELNAEIASNPPPGRLRVWQARALLDDLESWRAGVISRILSVSTDPPEAVSQWASANEKFIAQAQAIITGQPDGTDRLATAGLAIRRLQRTLG